METCGLMIGARYDVASLELVGWTERECVIDDADGCMDGYSYLDYFRDGEYLGPDQDRIEPLFVRSSVRQLVA